MLEAWPYVAIVLQGVLVAFAVLTLRRLKDQDGTAHTLAALQQRLIDIDRLLRDELARHREVSERQARSGREELAGALQAFAQRLSEQSTHVASAQKSQLELVINQLQNLTASNEQRLLEWREAMARKLTQLQADANVQASMAREEHARGAKTMADTLEKLRGAVDARLMALQADNAAKLEQMRATVDEKLHATLEKRLGESFQVVSDRLEVVHKGLGEMQNLAKGVGDLKKVLTNIKTRGTWGEVQLGNLLEQVLVPEQYAVNVAVSPERNERVEFAIKLPGKENDTPVWLPIDAKFPQEDYQRLVDAADTGDAELVAICAAKLETQILLEAKKIRDKYVQPPYTTDFAVLFLPTEGLFAEVLRRPGLCERIQQEHRVVLAGPTTLTATLNSLQMGFRTLAIEKRSSEVWQVLGAVKTEFGKFEAAISHVKKKLQEAANSVDKTETRTRQLQRRLKTVEALPEQTTTEMLGTPSLPEIELPWQEEAG